MAGVMLRQLVFPLLLWLAPWRAGAGPFDQTGDQLVDKPFEQLSNKDISDWGRAALEIDASKWKQGETQHFIIHYFQRGQKIATRCETFYQQIRVFFGNREDKLGSQKSHL